MSRGTVRALPALLAGALLIGPLSACSLLRSEADPEVEYREAAAAPSLEVPPDLVRPQSEDDFNIPPGGEAPLSRSSVLPAGPNARAVRAGGQLWIELEARPESLWPRLQDFWHVHQYPMERDEPLLGLQETGWVERRPVVPETGLARLFGKLVSSDYSGSLMDKFRLRLERDAAASPPVTRLFLTHWGLRELVVGDDSTRDVVDTRWTWAGQDPDLQAELLNRLLVHLRIDQQRARGLLSAEAAERIAARAYLDGAPGRRSLVLNETYELAWIRLSAAVEAVGMVIEDADRESGTIAASYIGPAPAPQDGSQTGERREEKGFFARLFSTDNVERNFRLAVTEEPGQTRVAMSETDAPDGQPLAGHFLERLLAELR